MLLLLLLFRRHIKPLSNIRDFRLIILVSGVYKILAKVLAYHLRGVLDGLISKS